MKKAFTLIELLVVIAIIAILAAILFPVFAQAKEAAKKSTCLSNQKQIGLGVMMYLGDSDDVIPPSQYGAGDTQVSWSALIYPYIKNGQKWTNTNSGLLQHWADDGMWRCPTALPQSYNYGVHLDLFVDNWDDQVNGVKPAVNANVIDQVADKVIIMEKGRNDAFWGYMQFATWQWDWVNEGVRDWGQPGKVVPPERDNARKSDSFDCDGQGTAGTWAGCGMQPRYRHSGNANMVFADGHAKNIRKGGMKWYKNIFVDTGRWPYNEDWYPY